MSIFTKIFVVLVMVLSVLLVALVVPYVMNTQTYKKAYDVEVARRTVAEFNAAQRESDLAALINAGKQEIAQRDQQIAALQAQINQAGTAQQQLQAELIQLQGASASVQANLARLATSLEQASQINQMLQTEVRERRENSLATQTRNIELNDRVRELSTISDTLTSQIRLLKEEYAALEQQYADAQRQMTGGPGAVAAARPGQPVQPGVTIRGMVTDVRRVGDETLVAVNVGRNDGVQQGMQFMVHSGDRYLGDAVVTTVDANSAAARVIRQSGEITPNAEILAGGL